MGDKREKKRRKQVIWEVAGGRGRRRKEVDKRKEETTSAKYNNKKNKSSSLSLSLSLSLPLGLFCLPHFSFLGSGRSYTKRKWRKGASRGETNVLRTMAYYYEQQRKNDTRLF